MVDWVDKCLAVSDLATLGTLGSVCWTAGGSICLPVARSRSVARIPVYLWRMSTLHLSYVQ